MFPYRRELHWEGSYRWNCANINSRDTVVSFPQYFGGLQPDLHTVEGKDFAENSVRTSGTILSACMGSSACFQNICHVPLFVLRTSCEWVFVRRTYTATGSTQPVTLGD